MVSNKTVRVPEEFAEVLQGQREDQSVIEYFLSEGFLSSSEERMRLYDSKGKLTDLGVEVTESCNLNCVHCCVGEKTSSKLGLKEFTSALENFASLGGIRVDITGGEPTTLRDLSDYLAVPRSFDMKVTVSTNGTLINQNIAEQFARLRIAHANVTLSGMQEQHERIYGENTFRRTIRGINLLRDQGVDVVINYNLHPGNIDDLTSEEFLGLVSDLGIHQVIPSPIMLIGNAEGTQSFELSPEIYKKFFGVRTEPKDVDDSEGLACAAQKSSLFLKSNGDVLPCHMFTGLVIGNVYANSLREIYESQSPLKEFKYSDLEECVSCEVVDACQGGCRGRAFAETGSMTGVDPEMCRIYHD